MVRAVRSIRFKKLLASSRPPSQAVASNWRTIGTPVDTPQVGDVAIARPGWAPRRGSGETGQIGSHVTFVNQADPTGTFQGLGGNQGSMVKPFNARDFEFRRLPGDVQGHRIVGIPGEQAPETQVAAYAPTGGVSDAPIPGMGGAGAPRLGPPPAAEAGVTPVDIEPAPLTAQFGPPAGRFTRTDAPVPGIGAPAAPMAVPQTPPAPAVAPSRPSQEPIPPATEQEMPDPGPPPSRPAARPMTQTQQHILNALSDPRLDPNGPDAILLKDRFARDEAERKRMEDLDKSDYLRQQNKWEQDTTAFMKHEREREERRTKQLGERVAIGKAQSEAKKIERELAGKETKEIGGVIYERDPAGAWQAGRGVGISPGSPASKQKSARQRARRCWRCGDRPWRKTC